MKPDFFSEPAPTPTDEPDKPAGGSAQAMDDETFATTIGAIMADGIQYMDLDVAPDQESATAYYRGDPFGNEEEGRSQVVMTEVRDTVQAMMPALLRIFCGSEKPAEFAPNTEQDVAAAEQATDYINYLFMSKNNGFLVLHNAFKDALVRKTGILYWYVEKKSRVEELDFSGLTQEEVDILQAEDDLEVLDVIPDEEQAPSPDPSTPAEQTFTLRVRRTTRKNAIRVETIPPEELFISRDAKDEDDAAGIGRHRDITMSELVSMGFDKDEIEEHGGAGDDSSRTNNGLALVRNNAINMKRDTGNAADGSLRTYHYFEGYIRVDRDGDGIAERRYVRGLNPKNPHILSIDGELCDELWTDDVPLGILCPDIEPHTAIGYSITDQIADLQEIKTSVIRNTLDSLANSIHPRTAIVEGQVNVDDAMNTEVGAIIRQRAPGMVQPLAMPFVGQYALPLVAYLDNTRAQRTGITEASQGLDADVLQSTTKSAVTATVSAAQERIEMIARVFAETGLTRMMKGLLRLVIRHSDKKQVYRLRKKWVSVDPRVWDADMDVTVNIGLGRGTDQDRLTLYSNVATKQEQIIQLAGPSNPLCGLKELRNTYAKIMEIGGERDVSKFFKEIDEQALAAQAAQQPQQPNPAIMLAQIEQAKAQAQAQKFAADALLDRQKHADDVALRREQMAQDRLLKMAEIEARYNANINEAALDAQVQRERDSGQIMATMHGDLVTSAQADKAATADRLHNALQAGAQRAHDAQQADANRAAQAAEAEANRSAQAQQPAQSGGQTNA